MSAVERGRAPEPAAVRPFHFPAVERRALDNGLNVLVAESRRFPVVSLQFVVNAGGTAE